MKKLVFISMMVYLLSATFIRSEVSSKPSPSPTVDSADSPKVFIPCKSFDFGEVSEGPDFTPTFKFYNKGKKNLRVEYRSQGSEWHKSETTIFWIKPNHYHLFKTTYHTAGRPGHVTKVLNFWTNDPENIEVKIDMKLNVIPSKK